MPLLTYNEFAASQQKGGSIREDLLDFIANVSPRTTPLFNNLGSIGVDAGYVEFLQDSFDSAGVNAWIEGAAATDVTLTTPSRQAVHVQNFQKHFWVSGRQQAVTHAGLSNMLSYQEMKKTVEIKNDIEHALHRGSAVTGNTDTAPQFAGLLNVITTFNTSSSGTTLTESVFNDLVTQVFESPVNIREVYCNMLVKRTINGYTTNVTRNIDADARRQLNLVNVYESEIGVLGIFKSRDQLQAADKTSSGNSFVAIDPDYFFKGWLRPLQSIVLGKDGDRERRMLVTELTLVPRHEKGGVAATDYVAYLP